ncbi:MAG: hypothetical protein KDD77_11520, partial [Caldilineaceae bacterium]|nr:hypothetical protein [Caldilineaceae bacterium]
ADPRLQAIMSSMYIAGYRLGMLAAGAGALVLAEQLGSSAQDYLYPAWRWSYLCMAALMVIGLVTTCLVREPERASAPQTLSVHTYLGFIGLFVLAVLGFVAAYVYSSASIAGIRETLAAMLDNRALAGVLSEGIRLCLGLAAFAGVAFGLIRLGWVEAALVRQTYVAPVADFFRRYGLKSAAILLALIGLYRVSDIVLGVISNVFYQDLGFSKTQIATIVKSYGLGATIAGGFLGGVLAIRFGVMRILLLGAVLSAATNVLFMWLAQTGGHELGLYLVITADNLSAGLASTAFVAFLSGLTNISFTAMQYALFSSLMTLIPKGLGGYSGSMVDGLGYSEFFMVTALMGVPVIVLIVYIQRTRILSMDPLPEQR